MSSSVDRDVVVQIDKDFALRDKATTECLDQVTRNDWINEPCGEAGRSVPDAQSLESLRHFPDNIEPTVTSSNCLRSAPGTCRLKRVPVPSFNSALVATNVPSHLRYAVKGTYSEF